MFKKREKIYKKFYLSKLKKNVFTEYDNIYCDFETVISSDNTHHVTCYAIIGKNINIVEAIDIKNESELITNSELLLIKFINDCIKLSKNNSRFYFHNFSNFDSIFLLKIASKLGYIIDIYNPNKVLYNISIHANGNKLKFYDSYHLLPFSLSTLAETFINDTQKCKLKLDHENIQINDYINNKEFIHNLKQYCYIDAEILYFSFEKACKILKENLKIDPLSKMTIASLSFKLFRTYYYNENTIQLLPEYIDDFIRQSYKGGYTDVFKPYLKNGYYYDVNSLYPYVMSNYAYPGEIIDKFKIVDDIKSIKDTNQDLFFDINNFFGFIKVEVKCPENLNKPFLTYNHPEFGLITPVGSWTAVYFSEELKYAIKLGYTFKYIEGIEFNQIRPFNNYINDLYNKRIKCKKSDPLNTIYKLLLNSLYGKFGMKYKKVQTIIGNEDLFNHISVTSTIIDFFKNDDNYIIEYENTCKNYDILTDLLSDKVINLDEFMSMTQSNSNKDKFHTKYMSHIASAITAYARIYMHNFINDSSLNVYYTDTDSIVSEKKLPSHLVSDIEIGKFKLVYSIEEAYFLSPKQYAIKINSNEIICKSKGLMKIDDFNIYKHLYENPLKAYKSVFTNFFRRNMKNFEIKKQNSEITNKNIFLKRHKIFTNSKWTDTYPIKLNNDNIET